MNKLLLSGTIVEPSRLVNKEGQITHAMFLLSVSHRCKSGTLRSELYRIHAWNNCAKYCMMTLSRGMRVALSCHLTQRSIDQNGSVFICTEIAVDEVLSSFSGTRKEETGA